MLVHGRGLIVVERLRISSHSVWDDVTVKRWFRQLNREIIRVALIIENGGLSRGQFLRGSFKQCGEFRQRGNSAGAVRAGSVNQGSLQAGPSGANHILGNAVTDM